MANNAISTAIAIHSLSLSGRNELKENLPGIEHLVLDFAGLEYLSSAGLRVLLGAQKQMNKQGEMVIRNVRPEIMEIFDVTGFSDILTIE